MILLDTNVLSALMQRPVETVIEDWMNQWPEDEVFTTSINIYEIRFGLNQLPQGRRRGVLEAAFEALIVEDLQNRVIFLDQAAAEAGALLAAERQALGRQVSVQDTLIAGIAISNHAAIATRNVKDFQLLPVLVINPWAS